MKRKGVVTINIFCGVPLKCMTLFAVTNYKPSTKASELTSFKRTK